jgi:hypothetical protein
VYNGSFPLLGVGVVGKDGVTPVAGALALAFNGGKGVAAWNAGTITVLATFTSADSHYGDATLLTTFTITKANPVFAYLSASTIVAGTGTTTFSGHVGAGTAVPAGDMVIATLNGVSRAATVDPNGNFTTTFATATLPVGTDTITFAFAGDSNFNAAALGSTTLKVIPTAPPQVTLNPHSATVTAGDPVYFTVAGSGSPVPSVQWQVSSDGGKTFTDITGNPSAKTTTLVFITSTTDNGYQFRAVFTNSVGNAISSVATLRVESDTGGGD